MSLTDQLAHALGAMTLRPNDLEAQQQALDALEAYREHQAHMGTVKAAIERMPFLPEATRNA